jgi:HSP20 family protein
MLLRFDPFREADRIFDELRGRQPRAAIPMDAYRRGDTCFVHLDLPGIHPGSIDLTVEQDAVTVKAGRSWHEHEGDELVVCEWPQHTDERSLYLSERLDAEHLDASYEHGVLTIRIPVHEVAKARHIPVVAAGAPEPVGAGASS